jgi:predicted porin
MKTKLSQVLALAIATAAAPVYAQSSVTLYGIVDNGILYNSNGKGGSQIELSQGNLSGERWGLRGTEDLGGGYGTIFDVENGFNVNTGSLGQGGAEFGRQAFVGISAPFGTVTVGRHYDTETWTTSGLTLGNSQYQGGTSSGQIAGVIGMHPGDLDNLDNTNRVNNSILYTSRVYGGIQYLAEYSLGGVAGSITQDQIWSTGISYKMGPLTAAASLERAEDPNFSFFGNDPTSSTTGNNMTSPVYSGYASAKAQTIAVAGVSYQIGSAILGAVYSNVRFTGLGALGGAALNSNNFSGTASFNTGEINLGYYVTPFLLVGTGFSYTQGSSVDGLPSGIYRQVDFGTDYVLSKRTDLYAVVSYQRASGDNSLGEPAVASIYSVTPSSSNAQTAAEFGIRTKF